MGISLADYMTMEARLAEKGLRKEPSDATECKRESDLHRQIMEFCQNKGWLCFHGSMAHKTYRTIGEPDLTICADKGRTFFVECKKKGGKPTREQLAMIAMLKKLGHKAEIVWSLKEFTDSFHL